MRGLHRRRWRCSIRPRRYSPRGRIDRVFGAPGANPRVAPQRTETGAHLMVLGSFAIRKVRFDLLALDARQQVGFEPENKGLGQVAAPKRRVFQSAKRLAPQIGLDLSTLRMLSPTAGYRRAARFSTESMSLCSAASERIGRSEVMKLRVIASSAALGGALFVVPRRGPTIATWPTRSPRSSPHSQGGYLPGLP